MDTNLIQVLKDAIQQSLVLLNPFVNNFYVEVAEWRKINNSQWKQIMIRKNDLSRLFSFKEKELLEINEPFIKLFREKYAASGEDYFIGTICTGYTNILFHLSIIRSILFELWDQYGTFEISKNNIDKIIQEFFDLINSPKVSLQFHVVLLNYEMKQDVISFANNFRIRRLSNEEVSQFYNFQFQSKYELHRYQFIIEGEFEEENIVKIGNESEDINLIFEKSIFYSEVKPKIDNLMLTLKTFKSGNIGYDGIYIKANNLYPSSGGGILNDSYIPFGTYKLFDEEIPLVISLSKKIFSGLDDGLKTACKKLAEAESSIKSEDRILNAVVGLESILLAALTKDERRGELKFRFSLNYSTLFSTPEERKLAYRQAKDIYDIRSTIAHGGDIKDKPRFGYQKEDINFIAQESCRMLRYVINYFLDLDKAVYKKPEFWENGYFGIEPRLEQL